MNYPQSLLASANQTSNGPQYLPGSSVTSTGRQSTGRQTTGQQSTGQQYLALMMMSGTSQQDGAKVHQSTAGDLQSVYAEVSLGSSLSSSSSSFPPSSSFSLSSFAPPQQLPPPPYSHASTPSISSLSPSSLSVPPQSSSTSSSSLSNAQCAPKRPPKCKTELRGASEVVLETPPIISSSPEGWKACCLTLCKCAYVRNNKRGGLKNLRCFPHCLPGGHNPLGFCGSSVYTRVWLPPHISSQQYVVYYIFHSFLSNLVVVVGGGVCKHRLSLSLPLPLPLL